MRINSFCIFLEVALMAVGASAAASDVRRPAMSGSPMDALDREKMPSEARKTLPPDVVAVMDGDPRLVAALAFTPDERALVLAHLGGSKKGDAPGTIEVWHLDRA